MQMQIVWLYNSKKRSLLYLVTCETLAKIKPQSGKPAPLYSHFPPLLPECSLEDCIGCDFWGIWWYLTPPQYFTSPSSQADRNPTGQHTKALSAMLLARTLKNERQTSENCKESIKKEKKRKLGMAAFCFENTQQMHI